jgi:hypothetical protein
LKFFFWFQSGNGGAFVNAGIESERYDLGHAQNYGVFSGKKKNGARQISPRWQRVARQAAGVSTHSFFHASFENRSGETNFATSFC